MELDPFILGLEGSSSVRDDEESGFNRSLPTTAVTPKGIFMEEDINPKGGKAEVGVYFGDLCCNGSLFFPEQDVCWKLEVSDGHFGNMDGMPRID